MPQVAFCCSNSRGLLLERRVAEVENLVQARAHAMTLVHSLIATAPAQDWRRYRLYARDERGADLFVMPFWSTPSKPGLTTRLKAVLGRAWS
jgi:hypothetical protein